MKNINEFINESTLNESKNSLGFDKNYQVPVTWELAEWGADGEGIDPDEMDFDDDTSKDAIILFDEVFTQYIKDGMTVDLGNWFPDENDDDWDYFYEETGLSKRDHGLVLHQDGDDGTFTVLVFANRIPSKYKKYINDFKDMFSYNTVAEF
jgi:hypothetical protein